MRGQQRNSQSAPQMLARLRDAVIREDNVFIESAQRRFARHRPEESLLYTIVEQHGDAFFEHLAERDAMLPGFVRDEFDAYLRCGRLEHGFLRVKCSQCRHEHLVAFSCKCRGYAVHRIIGDFVPHAAKMTIVLRESVLREIEPASQVFQAAHVYGRMQPDLARKIGPEGCLDVVDVVPLQVELCQRKLNYFSNARVCLADAASRDERRYDAVVCYFLLHEIPEEYKHAVVDALLERLVTGGKAVFVDYHRPASWHPLGGLMRLVFRTLEPFATGLTDNEICSFATGRDNFQWSKQTFFGGL